jgi:gliding motility-associated-like protein
MNSGSGWNDINNGSIYQGATSNSLTIVSSDITLNNNLYRCKINGTCNSIFSSAAALTVTLSQIPEVSLTASSNAAVCANTPINFTATPGGGGTAPSYQWQLNGVNVGTDNPSYTDAAPVDGDMVKCIMTSNAICATASTASSNSIAISILPPVTPAVSITASSVNICANTPVTFNASADNGGLTPSYQWELNSVATATGGSTYTTTALNDGDVISCVMTGSAGCMISPTAASNDIVMKVNRPAPAAITISASSPSACEDEDLSFTATATNGGNTPLYQWKVNDKDEGINENIFISHSLTNGDQVSCVLTSSTTCVSPVHSNNLSAVINPLPVVSAGPDTALFIGNSVQLYAHVTGAIFNYDWTPADGLSATSIANPIAAPDDSITYYLTVTTNDGCKGYGKVKIALLRHLLMPNAFTPNNDGKNDVFRIPYGSALELEDFSIYDRWGSLVFKTTDIGKGWDGYSKGIPAGAGGYAYFIRGIFQKKEVTVKGMVLLVR